jgi:hypothetical protein
MLSKVWVWDPGSGIRDPGSEIRKKPIPDPGSRGQNGNGSRIPDPQHCKNSISGTIIMKPVQANYDHQLQEPDLLLGQEEEEGGGGHAGRHRAEAQACRTQPPRPLWAQGEDFII